MADSADLRYEFRLRILGRPGTHTVVAHDIREALRRLMFRKNPRRSQAENLAAADSLYDSKGYEILGQAPMYSEIFRPELAPRPRPRHDGPTLRDIAEDMEDMENIKDILNDEDTDEPEDRDEDEN